MKNIINITDIKRATGQADVTGLINQEEELIKMYEHTLNGLICTLFIFELESHTYS